MVWPSKQNASGKTPQTSFVLAKANGKTPVGRPRTGWTVYIEDLGWNSLVLYPSEMMDVIEDRQVWRLYLELLPHNPHGKAGNEERRKKKEENSQQF